MDEKKFESNIRVGMVLDCSGSMNASRHVTIEGFNKQVEAIREEDFNTKITLVKFSSSSEFVRRDEAAANITLLTEEEYKPNGGTALYDAVGDIITYLKETAKSEDECYLVTILSDGEENQSTRWEQTRLAEQIQELEKTNRWTFTYVGSNQNLAEVQEKLNIPVGNMCCYDSSPVGTATAFQFQASNTKRFIKGRHENKNSRLYKMDNFYSDKGNITDLKSDVIDADYEVKK